MSDEPQRPNKEQLIKIVTEVYENRKESLNYMEPMVEDLNKTAVPRLRGHKPWTVKYLEAFLRNHIPGLRGGQRSRRKAHPRATEKKRQAAPFETEAQPVQRDEQVLQEIIEWWKSGRAVESKASLSLASHYPTFRDEFKKANRSLSLRTEIVQRAETKIQRDKTRTGATLPNLVDLLLWYYIGCPGDLVEPPYEETDEQK